MTSATSTATAPLLGLRGTSSGIGLGACMYFGTLTVASALGDPVGLLSLPLQITLKDRLGLGPQGLALFETLLFVPVYLGFLFGFLRDRWRPFGLGDRGYLLVGGMVATACYLWLAAGELALVPIFGGLFLSMAAFQALDVASDALLTAVAQRHFMTGRLSAVVEGAEALPGIAAVLVGGWMATNVSLTVPLAAAALCSVVVMAHAFWYPRHVFPETAASSEGHLAALSRLWAHRPLRSAVLVGAVWNLSIGWGTPYLFFLTEGLELSGTVVGVCRATGLACALIMAPVYSLVCQRRPLSFSLRLAVVASLLPGFLYLLASDAPDVIAVSVLVGLPTAFGHIALFDLLRRACPRDLEGTAITLAFSTLAVAVGVGDLLGSWIYAQGGFAACLVIDAVANAAVLPLLRRLPASLVSRRDGEADLDGEPLG